MFLRTVAIPDDPIETRSILGVTSTMMPALICGA